MTTPVRFVTIPRFASESGYTEDAIRTKIRDGVWREGDVWVKAPDGRSMIRRRYGKFMADAAPEAGNKAEALFDSAAGNQTPNRKTG